MLRILQQELRNWVSKEIGPIARPDEIRFGDNLPKTRSGKIMRRYYAPSPRARKSPRMCPRWKTRQYLEQLKLPGSLVFATYANHFL